MSDIVNLNRARKKKARAGKEKRAEENRAKFGRTTTNKKASSAEQAKLDRHLDGHERSETD